MSDATPKGPLPVITVPLGDGLVGVAFTRDQAGTPGVLMRPLANCHEIGCPVPAGNALNCGVFIRCPSRNSAEVLRRMVSRLCESFESEGST